MTVYRTLGVWDGCVCVCGGGGIFRDLEILQPFISHSQLLLNVLLCGNERNETIILQNMEKNVQAMLQCYDM